MKKKVKHNWNLIISVYFSLTVDLSPTIHFKTNYCLQLKISEIFFNFYFYETPKS